MTCLSVLPVTLEMVVPFQVIDHLRPCSSGLISHLSLDHMADLMAVCNYFMFWQIGGYTSCDVIRMLLYNLFYITLQVSFLVETSCLFFFSF